MQIMFLIRILVLLFQLVQTASREDPAANGRELLVQRITSGLNLLCLILVVLALGVAEARPWRIAYDDIESSVEVARDSGTETAEHEGGGFLPLCLSVSEAMENFATEIAREFENLRWARAGIEFDSRDIERQRG